jgi:hypothetical protein
MAIDVAGLEIRYLMAGEGGPMGPLLRDTYGSRVCWGIVPRGSRARFAAFSEMEIAQRAH